MTLLNNKQPLAHEMVEDSNPSNNIDFQTIISRRLNRRSILKGGTGLTAAAFFGALPLVGCSDDDDSIPTKNNGNDAARSEEHTSELQSRENLVCRLLLEKKKNH